jgi:hypothetical protein
MTTTDRRQSTTHRGYGWRHQRIRTRLLFQLKDGTPCPGCGRPMYRDPAKNHDRAPLEADHEADLKHHGPGDANRLLCRTCNRSRGAGHDERLPLNRDPEPDDTSGPTAWSWL